MAHASHAGREGMGRGGVRWFYAEEKVGGIWERGAGRVEGWAFFAFFFLVHGEWAGGDYGARGGG